MSWTLRKDHYTALARKIEPSCRLTTKDGWFWKVLAVLLHALTFGKMSYSTFLEDYGTTIGPVIASPRAWTALSEGYLVHEATHAADMRKAGLWIHPWVGIVPFGLVYLLFIFPMGLAWARYRLELRADTARWKHELSAGGTAATIRYHAQRRGEALSGAPYAWAWPWALEPYKQRAEAVIQGKV